MNQEIILQHCTVIYTDAGCTVIFPDGARVDAIPHPQLPHYHVISHRVGLGDDLMAYCRSHEVCHALVAEFFYNGPSKVLWALAHDQPHDWCDDIFEEIATQTLQRLIHANERPIVGDVNWDGLKRRALEAFDQIGVTA